MWCHAHGCDDETWDLLKMPGFLRNVASQRGTQLLCSVTVCVAYSDREWGRVCFGWHDVFVWSPHRPTANVSSPRVVLKVLRTHSASATLYGMGCGWLGVHTFTQKLFKPAITSLWSLEVCHSDHGIGNINALCHAWLVLGWMSSSTFNSWCGKFISV